MPSDLPAELDCRRLLASGGKLSGDIAGSALRRIDGLFRAAAAAAATLTLARDESGAMVVSGTFRAPLEAQCQRCLEWFLLTVEGEFELDVREAPAAASAPRDDDDDEDDGSVLTISAGRLPVHELIEDEILLACPMVPLHDTPACHAAPETTETASAPRQKPFAALGEMMATQDQGE